MRGVDVATLKSPLHGVLGQLLDEASIGLSIALDCQSQTSALVDQVAIVVRPELDVEQSVLVGRGSSGLGVKSGVGTSLHVVLEQTVLNVDNVAVRSTDVEVGGRGETLDLASADELTLQVSGLALVHDIQLLLLNLGNGALQGQPREANLGEGPALNNLIAADLTDESAGTLATIGQEQSELAVGSEAENTLLNNPTLGLGTSLGGLNELGVRVEAVYSEDETRATVDNVTVLEAPELELQESVRVLARLELLVGKLDVGTGLEVVDLTAVLDLENKIADARLEVEPTVDGSGLVLLDTGQMVRLVLLQELLVSLGGVGVAGLGGQPREGNRLKGPALVQVLLVLALAKGDAGAIAGTITIDIKDKVGLALEVNESAGDAPLLVGITLGLAAPLDDLAAGLELVAGNIKDQTSATVNDEPALEAPELKLQKSMAGG